MPRVLYVEDDRINLVLMDEVFRRLPADQGWTLDCAETGAEALALLAQNRPDLLLVDMNLPDMHGTELLARLPAGHPPCVAVSADALPEQISAARAAGFVDYWTKPIDVRQISAALQHLTRC